MTAQPKPILSGTAVVIAADEAMRASLTFLLQTCGLAVTEVEGPEQLERNGGSPPDHIFMDCELVEESGGAILSALRQRGWTGSAILMAEDEQACARAAYLFDNCIVLTKPFSSEDVLAAIGGD